MLIIAKKRGIQVIQALGERLPFRGNSFDYVLMINTLCFLDKPGVVLEESAKVLRNGGRLFVCDIVRDSEWGRFYEERGQAGHRLYSQARFYSCEELERLLKDHGFKVVDARATLKSRPKDPEKVEVPSKDLKGRGFICLAARHSEP
jgi:ubiquinone/menaquinone biosynthesis C-methylase UbiE